MDYLDVLKKYDQFIFTGTMSFVGYGVYWRKPKDVDILVTPMEMETIKGVTTDSLSEGGAISKVVKEENLDIFLLDQEIIQDLPKCTREIEYRGVKIRVANPYFAARAKKKYVQNYVSRIQNYGYVSDKMVEAMAKHYSDMAAYGEWLMNNPEEKKIISSLIKQENDYRNLP